MYIDWMGGEMRSKKLRVGRLEGRDGVGRTNDDELELIERNETRLSSLIFPRVLNYQKSPITSLKLEASPNPVS